MIIAEASFLLLLAEHYLDLPYKMNGITNIKQTNMKQSILSRLNGFASSTSNIKSEKIGCGVSVSCFTCICGFSHDKQFFAPSPNDFSDHKICFVRKTVMKSNMHAFTSLVIRL